MLLIFNTIIAQTPRNYFDTTVAKRISFGFPYEIIHLEDEIPDLGEFSHLLLTGSELSASQASEWDKKIISVIRKFLEADKSILGICHGHQMVARTIAGDGVCRRASKPEFGWKKMIIKDNALFKEIARSIFLESRYDEVYGLDNRFHIIAKNDCEAVQAFQLKGKNVWGIQFHPEMLLADGNKMLENHLIEHPEDRHFYTNELEEESEIESIGNEPIKIEPIEIESNLNIFRNFLDCQGLQLTKLTLRT